MKTKFLLFALLVSSFSFAQFDDKFYQPNKKFTPITEVNYNEFKIPVERDTIAGLFLKPEGQSKATVLFFQGAGGNPTSYLELTEPLVKAGYQVFMIGFRGYGKSTGTPTHKNIQQDAQKFLDYVLIQPELRKQKIIVYGVSMGSQAATNLTKNNQGKIDALVLDGTISSFTDLAVHFAPAQESLIRQVPFPYSAEEDIKSISIPTLFIHSKEDKMVPYTQAEEVFANAKEPKEFLTYTGDHLNAMKTVSKEIIAKIDTFIK